MRIYGSTEPVPCLAPTASDQHCGWHSEFSYRLTTCIGSTLADAQSDSSDCHPKTAALAFVFKLVEGAPKTRWLSRWSKPLPNSFLGPEKTTGCGQRPIGRQPESAHCGSPANNSAVARPNSLTNVVRQ